MKRGSEEIKEETSPLPAKHFQRREVSIAEDIGIPIDLMVEILKKLPAKSLIKFQCVSKQWSSIIGSSRDFIDSIVTRSLSQPSRDILISFSTTLTNSLKQISSSFPLRTLDILTKNQSIYNPTTRQSLSLPETTAGHSHVSTSFLGYDPFKNQYKVICLDNYKRRCCHVFTLGDAIRKWRKIQYNFGLYFPLLPPVCIKGTIYYQAKQYGSTYVLLCFDVISEKFDQVEAPKTMMDHRYTLINYQGKLGFMCCQNRVEIWVMKNDEKKQEWSKIFFYEMAGFEKWHIARATPSGEIVFVNRLLLSCQTLYVYYYGPKRNSMRRVEVEGTKYRRKHLVHICPVPDHVENTMRL
ncbi:F-box associated domain type 3 [Arabidopsis thaliana x Arabidopsis arenosa]|uniref:F-box associated domain type 3 n=1 Tax=Arabidopsis thaliana x Arabidopsis arenosa TaxID=1240361 RepID=A0A8T2D5E2_9BRAS|nr:F-box associated domain type 3 [Arabidopsis thaliana x Arabidopsis arenosa]